MPDTLRTESDIARADGEPDVARPAAESVEVASGPGEPAAARLVEDPYTGVRADHLGPLGPSGAAVIPDGPSVWEATGEGDE